MAEIRIERAYDPPSPPAKRYEFRGSCQAELTAHAEALEKLGDLLRAQQRITLLFAARDAEHNNAVALREALESRAEPV